MQISNLHASRVLPTMSEYFCCCPDCVIARIERLEELARYAMDLESLFRVAERLLAAGENDAVREIVHHGGLIARERDLAREVHAEQCSRDILAAQAARVEGRLH